MVLNCFGHYLVSYLATHHDNTSMRTTALSVELPERAPISNAQLRSRRGAAACPRRKQATDADRARRSIHDSTGQQRLGTPSGNRAKARASANCSRAAERGRRRAPRSPSTDQAEPTRSATASTTTLRLSFPSCSGRARRARTAGARRWARSADGPIWGPRNPGGIAAPVAALRATGLRFPKAARCLRRS